MVGGGLLGLADDEGVFDGEVGGVVAEVGHFGLGLESRFSSLFVRVGISAGIEGFRWEKVA